MRLFLALIITCNILLFAQQTGARYLIITHDDYYDAILPLAEWKTRKGLKAKIARLSEIGSDSTQIKGYVTNAYNTWQIRPEYLLLVGDKDQLPFPRRAGTQVCHTDNYYTNVTGDFHNEIIPGRFWVSDTLEAKTVVTKVLSYEKDPYIDDSLWFGRGVTIINTDTVPGDSNYWSVTRFAHELMINARFNRIDSLLGIASTSGFIDTINHNSMHVIDAINNGCSYITYRGEAFQRWCLPFMNIYPTQMTNGSKLPIVISATCATVDGIGYEWLCAGTPDTLKGVVGFLGTTTGLLQASVERSALMRGTLNSIFLDSLSTLGQAAEVGRLEYYQQCGDSLDYDGWNCLGDPEMTVRTGTPRTLQVSHPSEIIAGVCTVQVYVQHNSAPVESALVCVMAIADTTMYHYGRTDGAGWVAFVDTVTVVGDSILVTVTARNARPYCGLIRVHNAGSPYVILNAFFLDDSLGGNGDAIANPGEDIDIPVWLKNWGDTTAYGVSATIQEAAPDAYVALSDTIKNFGDIPSLDSACVSDGFNVFLAPDCPDLHEVELQLMITDSQNFPWISPFNFIVHAPVIFLEDHYFAGGVISTAAGDTTELICELRNAGTYVGENVEGKLTCSDSLFTVVDSLASFGSIFPDSTSTNQTSPFVVTSDPQTPFLTPVTVHLEITSGVYVGTTECVVYVGRQDYYIWDLDPNHSSGPVIQDKLNELNFVGEYGTAFPNGFASAYNSIFVCCGVYPNNHPIADTGSSAQEIEFYVTSQTGKVYLEGGDVWSAPNNGYDFSPLFGLHVLGTNVGPLSNITGCDGSFTESMLFRYQGEGVACDHFDTLGGSSVIFKSTYNDRNIGVVHNHRTVGVSFEFGGLVDTIAPSSKSILIDSIMQYFGIPPTGIRENQQLRPSGVAGLAVYPNPCRSKMCIKYNLGQYAAENATLRVFDVTGRLVKEFGQLDADQSPLNQVTWGATDQLARRLSTGVYFVELKTDNYTDTKKVILLE